MEKKTPLTQWLRLSLWRTDRIDELQERTQLFTDPEGEEAMFQTGAITLKIERDEQKNTWNCFEWFTVMPIHCATCSVIKLLAEMCCSSAQMYQDVWRKTGRKTNRAQKTQSWVVCVLNYWGKKIIIFINKLFKKHNTSCLLMFPRIPQYVFIRNVTKNKQEARELFIVLFTHLQFGYKKSWTFSLNLRPRATNNAKKKVHIRRNHHH